jgi:hypothetical protein
MRPISFYVLLSIVLGSTIPGWVNADDEKVVVKSLSMWRMCELLDDNTHNKMKLQLTDLQVKKVIEFTSSKMFHDLLSEQERLARLRSERSRSDGNNDIYWAIEAEAIEEVKSFLSEKQIRELKNFSLEMRCDGGIMAFFDREICDACGIVIDDKFREFLQQRDK